MVAMTRNPGHRSFITPATQNSQRKEAIMTRTSAPTEYIILTGTKLRETEKAVHFRVTKVGDCDLEESLTFWFPFSQINKQSWNPHVDGTDTIHVARWICESKELI